jgi:parallel beta-helix repeat protein
MRIVNWLVLIGFSCGLLAGCGDDDDVPAGDGGARDAGPRDDGDSGARDGGKADGGGAARCTLTLSPGDEDQTMLQGALIDAVRGDTLCLAKGRYRLEAQLSLDVDGVTVRGEDGAVLDFSEQATGANGFSITADDVTLERVEIENPKGDGVRASSVRNLVVRGVRVSWTAGPSAENGGYGIYPVSSNGILIEDCYASGASDTGIYVGQSSRIIVRNNEVTENVAGIEIENSSDADVYGNHAWGNAAGILLFNLPGLPVKDGKRVNVRDNLIESNNHENFGPAGNIVSEVPPGTGMFVLASDDNEVHGNTITGNHSGGIAIVSWHVTFRDEEGEMDPEYDWFAERNYVHDNSFADNGDDLQGRARLIAGAAGEDTLPDMIWDGIYDRDKLERDDDGGVLGGDELVPPEELRNCFMGNGDGTFMALDLEHDGAGKSSDVTPYACERPRLLPIKL